MTHEVPPREETIEPTDERPGTAERATREVPPRDGAAGPGGERLALVEERLEVGKRTVERGRVVVRTRVETREAFAEADLHRDEVRVERVPVDRVVEAAPPVREEDGVLIVPVLEERLVVTTELVLREELRITKWRHAEHHREPVVLRSERAEVERLEGRDPDHDHERNDDGRA